MVLVLRSLLFGLCMLRHTSIECGKAHVPFNCVSRRIMFHLECYCFGNNAHFVRGNFINLGSCQLPSGQIWRIVINCWVRDVLSIAAMITCVHVGYSNCSYKASHGILLAIYSRKPLCKYFDESNEIDGSYFSATSHVICVYLQGNDFNHGIFEQVQVMHVSTIALR